jgi:hypothetical protein
MGRSRVAESPRFRGAPCIEGWLEVGLEKGEERDMLRMHGWTGCFVMLLAAALALPAAAQTGEEAPPAPPPSLSVTRAVACLEVRDREPQSVDTVFSNRTEQVVCFTQIEGASEETRIEHVWIHEGEERARVSLPVRSASWRTYSTKKLLPEWTGDWKVEIRDSAGNVLKSVEFKVVEGEPPGGAAESPESGPPQP